MFWAPMSWAIAFLLALGVACASWLAIGLLQRVLRRAGVLDHPNQRSSHAVPTARGAGLVLVPLVVMAWSLGGFLVGQPPPLGLLAATLVLAAVSWLDDLRGLRAAPRLLAQILAVFLGLLALGPEGSVSQGLLPFWLDRALLALAWLWFINLFNFMDGIDGISAVEGASLCVGLLLLAVLEDMRLPLLPVLLFAALLGFAYWNRPPARIFLGDVGSVSLGFLLGFLLAEGALAGYWAVALILPAYYWADASLTLLRRLLRGERVWQGHRQHWYQRAAAKLGHGAVCLRILGLNLVLLLLLVLSLTVNAWVAVLLAGVSTLLFLKALERRMRA